MNENTAIVLAVTGDGSARSVPEAAHAMARVLRADVAAMDVRRLGSDWPELVVAELRRRRVALAVLSADRPDDAPTWLIAGQASTPIVVVPPGVVVAPGATVSRVLVPLDGTRESATAVSATMSMFAEAGVDLVVLHVFDRCTTPRFWDQAAHARRAWEHEFRARFKVPAKVRITLRSGAPGEHTVRSAGDEHADLITLGWSQCLDPGRARTVRRVVRTARTPVMLVPMASPPVA